MRRRRVPASAEPIIPQRGRKKFIGPGKIRWVVEQVVAHLHRFKRLAVRWDRHLFTHQGFRTHREPLLPATPHPRRT